MPTNLYAGDNYNKNNTCSSALIRKFHEAKIKNKSIVKECRTGTVRENFCT